MKRFILILNYTSEEVVVEFHMKNVEFRNGL